MKSFIHALLFSFLFFSSQLWAVVNINQATAEEMAEAISGVGLVKAQAIVEYRKLNGPFETVDELSNVKGLGLKTIEKNRENMTTSNKK